MWGALRELGRQVLCRCDTETWKSIWALLLPGCPLTGAGKSLWALGGPGPLCLVQRGHAWVWVGSTWIQASDLSEKGVSLATSILWVCQGSPRLFFPPAPPCRMLPGTKVAAASDLCLGYMPLGWEEDGVVLLDLGLCQPDSEQHPCNQGFL